MLSNVTVSNKNDLVISTPVMEHPYPIKKHVDTLTPESLNSLKQHIGKRLLLMHYAKQLEEIFTLYDSIDPAIEKKYFENTIKNQINYNYYFTFSRLALSLGAVSIYLIARGHPIFTLQSWLKELYPITYIALFSYSALIYRDAIKLQNCNLDLFEIKSIMNARNEIHTNNVNIINRLRFNKLELK